MLFFIFVVVPSLPSLSLCPSLSLLAPRRPRPPSPPDNLPFLLQILNTCCPTALSRRDMCSLLPGSFACALAEVCIRPGPAAETPLHRLPSPPHRALSPPPSPPRHPLSLCVSCVPARPRRGLPPAPRPRSATRLHPARYICTRHGPTSARAYIGIVSENPPAERGAGGGIIQSRWPRGRGDKEKEG